MNGSWLLGLSRAIPYLLFTLALMPVQALAMALRLNLAVKLPHFYHRWSTRMLGLKIVVWGKPSGARPTLFVSNHSSYFDIEVLASLLETSFIAKAEMKDWPFFGWLAKMQRSVFVDRKRNHVGQHANEIERRLSAGDNIVLFAEGTTSDGNRLLPFKSALFAVAEHASPSRPLTVQPVSIVATSLDGMPLGRLLRPIYAWHGDMPLLSHVWQALSLGKLTVVVEFHPPFIATGSSRKELAERCHVAVAEGVARALGGRIPDAAESHNDEEDDEEGEAIDAAA